MTFKFGGTRTVSLGYSILIADAVAAQGGAVGGGNVQPMQSGAVATPMAGTRAIGVAASAAFVWGLDEGAGGSHEKPARGAIAAGGSPPACAGMLGAAAAPRTPAGAAAAGDVEARVS